MDIRVTGVARRYKSCAVLLVAVSNCFEAGAGACGSGGLFDLSAAVRRAWLDTPHRGTAGLCRLTCATAMRIEPTPILRDAAREDRSAIVWRPSVARHPRRRDGGSPTLTTTY